MSPGAGRFTWPLEAVRQKRQWQLDAAQVRVVRAQTLVAESERRLRALEELSRDRAASVALAWQARPDPSALSPALRHLSGLHDEQAQEAARLMSLNEDLGNARTACARAERALEALQRHRDDAISAHRLQELRRQSAQADDDWITRIVSAEGRAA